MATKEKLALIQAAKQAARDDDLMELVNSNLATKPTERWRSLTTDHMEIVLYLVRAGDTVAHVCRRLGISPGLVYTAAHMDETFGAKLAEARTIGSYALADAVAHAHDDESLSDARVKIKSDNYKWLAARFNRRDFGEHVKVEANVTTSTKMPEWMLGQIIDVSALPIPEDDEQLED